MRAKKMYSEDVLSALLSPEPEQLNLDLVYELLAHICHKEPPGAILVFLPGWDKISSLHKILSGSGKFPESRFLIIPLHSMMPTVSQKSIFNRPPPGVRKIVIATNIAETSITIDDVVYVIDCGKIKMQNFDTINNLCTLKEEWVSVANARQRRGRAGRVQNGVCYHLFTRIRESLLDKYQLPEMLRTRLEEVILQAKILQVGKVEPFLQKVIDPPNPRALDLSLKLLTGMNALDSDEQLTPLGYHLANLPIDPQAGKMILFAAMFGCIGPVASIAASLSFKDAFVIPLGKEQLVDKCRLELSKGTKSDHLVLANVMDEWLQAEREMRGREFTSRNFLSRNTLELLKDMRRQFTSHLKDMKFLANSSVNSPDSNVHSNNIALIKAVICAGLYPNVAIVKQIKKRGKLGNVSVELFTPEDGVVKLHPKSINEKTKDFESRFLVYHQKLKSSAIYLHDTTMVYPFALIFFSHGFTVEEVKSNSTLIIINDSIRFSCSRETAKLFQVM
ncbi:hypothetical protein AAG570_005852 [Ranatra chinensis]|uniref:Helicase C-terminal domain-containing protein n=1 Tax=Ranatra chinensis TaxID=642074 RepID=A0ABD0XWB8_9HEMI